MNIPRTIQTDITKRLTESNKVVILYGPRQVGKTTLAKSIISDWPGRVLQISADEAVSIVTLLLPPMFGICIPLD